LAANDQDPCAIHIDKALALTDGNLSAHARMLEEAGYMRSRNPFKAAVP